MVGSSLTNPQIIFEAIPDRGSALLLKSPIERDGIQESGKREGLEQDSGGQGDSAGHPLHAKLGADYSSVRCSAAPQDICAAP